MLMMKAMSDAYLEQIKQIREDNKRAVDATQKQVDTMAESMSEMIKLVAKANNNPTQNPTQQIPSNHNQEDDRAQLETIRIPERFKGKNLIWCQHCGKHGFHKPEDCYSLKANVHKRPKFTKPKQK